MNRLVVMSPRCEECRKNGIETKYGFSSIVQLPWHAGFYETRWCDVCNKKWERAIPYIKYHTEVKIMPNRDGYGVVVPWVLMKEAKDNNSRDAVCFACKELKPKHQSAYGAWYCKQCASNPQYVDFFEKAPGIKFETLKIWRQSK